MKPTIKIFTLFIFLVCTLDSWGQIKPKPKALITGSEEYVKNDCNDTCVIVYKSYTVITIPNLGSLGENIIVYDNNYGHKTFVDVKDEYKAQYFRGIIDDKAIIVVETGLIISVFIYDLKAQRLVDSLMHIVDEPKVVNDKLCYSIMMSFEKVRRLNLSTCDNPALEFSGYVEFMYYDLKTRKISSSGNYKCIN
jgi:hypothetical protein